MKSYIVLMLCVALISATSCNADKSDKINVPTTVLEAFTAKFPSAEKTEWEMENEMEYEVEFIMNKEEYSAKFDKLGKWLETETEIEVSELPLEVSESIHRDFTGFTIKEAEKADTFDKGTVYEVEIEKDGEKLILLISPTGEILKNEASIDDPKNEEDNDED